MQTNHVPPLNMQTSTTGCCPKFSPKEWDDKIFTLKDKPFVKAKTMSFMYIPLNMGSVMTKTWKAIEDADADAKSGEFLMLSREVSPWKGEHYFWATKEVPGQENVKLSGKFKTKVFEGEFKNAKNWYIEMQKIGQDAGVKNPEVYFYYTTCPKCAKVYGKNYVVGFVKVG